MQNPRSQSNNKALHHYKELYKLLRISLGSRAPMALFSKLLIFVLLFLNSYDKALIPPQSRDRTCHLDDELLAFQNE